MQGNDEYKVGHGKPPKHTQFGAGKSGNPAGKTASQKKLEMKNAEAAMRIRERILRAAEARLVEMSTEEVIKEFVEPAMLKLLKDSEDRGLGAPVQDLRSSDGTMTPKPSFDVSRLSTAALIELQGAMNDQTPDDDES